MTTVRISKEAHEKLAKLANDNSVTMTEILDRAVEAFRKKLFFDKLRRQGEALRADKQAWREFRSEIEDLEQGTIKDGLDAEE
jgi:predicted transcriptional regulator